MCNWFDAFWVPDVFFFPDYLRSACLSLLVRILGNSDATLCNYIVNSNLLFNVVLGEEFNLTVDSGEVLDVNFSKMYVSVPLK